MTSRAKAHTRSIEILLVEDNPGDVLLIKEVMKTSKFPIHWTYARDGEIALNMLRGGETFSGQGEPDIVLLDLNLPKVDGREVLREVKKDEKLKHIPILILTSSNNSLDISTAYQDKANFYLVKPMDMD